MNNMINKIINSNKLYTITIVLSLVICTSFLSVSVESRPKDANRLSRNVVNQKIDPTTERPKVQAADSEEASNSTAANDLSLETTVSSNETVQTVANLNLRDHLQSKFQNFDMGFLLRLAVFISAFCLVIFASVFVKSLSNQTGASSGMYKYLDTKCGDEERLMSKGHASDYWEEDDEVVMFDAVDFKKEHYKD